MSDDKRHLQQRQASKDESQRRAENRPGAESSREQNADGENIAAEGRDGAVHHGGVLQLGGFSVEEQNKAREKQTEEDADKDSLNFTDPALPTVDESNIGDNEDEDRPADKIKETQGKNPADGDG